MQEIEERLALHAADGQVCSYVSLHMGSHS